jgi:hypothetical protein
MRRLIAIATTALAWTLLSSPGTYADNCSGLQDCYGSVQSAAGASAGMAVLIGLAVLYGPSLLRSLTNAPNRPDAVAGRPRGRSRRDREATDRVEPLEVDEEPIHYDEKIRADMAYRGWSPRIVEDAAAGTERVTAVRDQRYNLDGTREDAPATVHTRPDGWYVIRNDQTNDVVQVGGGRLTGWPPARPSGPTWRDSLHGRMAESVGMGRVAFAGPEPCYPVEEAHRAVEYCERHGVRILGLDAFHRTSQTLRPRPDLVLDCSRDRNRQGEASVPTCAARTREVLEEWRGESSLMVSITVEQRP